MDNSSLQKPSNMNDKFANDSIQISVVVCTYNRAELLASCLDSLGKQTLSDDQFEVIIVDNNSTDNTEEISEQYINVHPNFRVVIEYKQGLSHARNRGWQEANGEFVAFIDDDAKATPEWGEKILDAFHKVKPTPIAVGGKILPWHNCMPPAWYSDELETRSWGEEAIFLKAPWGNFGFSGSNMSFPKSILEKYAGFSDQLGMVGNKIRLGEETDFFLRIADEEKRFWYIPDLIIYHLAHKENMKIFYYLKRAFISGKTTSLIAKKLSFPEKKVDQIYRIVLFILSTPRVLMEAEHVNKTIILRLKQFSIFLGRLIR